jgi:hypothetical protein
MHVFGVDPILVKAPTTETYCITRDIISIVPIITINDLNGHTMQVQ